MFKPQQITETESRELLLDSYVTYVHSHHCANCGGITTFAQCFEVWLHPTKTRNSNLRDLRPIVGPSLKPLNMSRLDVPPKVVPICHYCVDNYKVVGRPEITTVKSSTEAWQETLRRKYAPPPAEPKVAKTTAPAPAKAVPTLDQI